MIRKLSSIVLILFITFNLAGCKINHRNNRNAPEHKQITLDEEQEKNIQLTTEQLEYRTIQLTKTIPAQFKAMNQYLDRIYAPINGKVTQVFVDPGTIVKIGQALIQIKSDEIGQIQLEFLQEYIVVTSNIKQMTAQYNLSKQCFRRENTLYKEGISSRAEYELANAQMLKDKANLDSLKIQKDTLIKVYSQRIALYGGNESTIRKAIATKKIYPFITLCANKNGIVLDRKVNPGEIIEKNKALFNIADLSTIWLVGYAFEKDASLLKIGQSVTGVFEKNINEKVYGKLSYVSSVLDEELKTLEVRADIPNHDFSIKPNMYAEMVVDVGEINALAAPNSALQKYGDYTFAYVKVAPHVYEERKVNVGQHNDLYSEIKSGLKKDEEVVSNGGFSLLGESIKMRVK